MLWGADGATAGDHARAAHRALVSLCVLAALTLAGSVVVAHASAGTQTYEPASAPGGATMAAATSLYDYVSYRGTVQRGTAQWYSFRANGAKRVLLQVWGRTQSCPVRASLVEAHGHTLSEIIASSEEILPFGSPLAAHSPAGAYYVRMDVDPYRSCESAGYAFTLSEPEQPDPCEGITSAKEGCAPVVEPGPASTPPAGSSTEPRTTTTPRTGTLPSKESVPAIDQPACDAALTVLRRATVTVERERALVRRGKANERTLRAQEANKLTVRRRERALCGY